jgi:polar amino acid transport system permease protein
MIDGMPLATAFDLDAFWHYAWPYTGLQVPAVREGLIVTLYVAMAAMVLGLTLGLLAAVAQTSRSHVARTFGVLYVTYFRGTPLIVQITLLYFGFAALGLYRFPDMSLLGLDVPGVAQAGILALGINKGAYVTEILRAGIASVDAGQHEAARAIGMSQRAVLRHVVLPQAARVSVPALGNEFNAILKDTSLLVVIGGAELFASFRELNAQLFLPFELFLAMSLYYLVLTTFWTLIQSLLERRLNRGYAVSAPRRIRLGESLWRKA